MAEFKLERFKYNWKGDWTTGTAYKRDDVTRVNGKSYVCVITHTASATFREDLTATLPGSNPPQAQPRWVVMTSGKEFVGEYTQDTAYNIGDIVKYDGILWLCVVPHTATGDPEESSNFEVFADTISYEGEWTSARSYGPNAIVKYNGIKYKAINSHTAGSSLEDNADDWEVFFEGSEYVNAWASDTTYRLNDIVKYGGTLFKCIEEHLSDNTFNDAAFSVEVFGTQFNGDWNSTVYYNIGDIVRHRGYMYYAVQNSYDSSPFLEDATSQDWILLAKTYYFTGDWAVSNEYKTGDIVLRGGGLYLALRDIGADNQDGSTADYLDDGTWELLVPGKSWKDPWKVESYYSEGDVVYFKGSSYTCNFEHESSLENFPGDNGNGFDYWDILIQSGVQSGLQYKGDLLTYGLSRELEGTADTSTLGNTRVPIGESEQILSVSADLEAFWRDITVDADVIYVSKNGSDNFKRGTFEKPFKTVRYAAEYVEDNFAPLTPVIIRVGTGRYDEIGPIIVPAGCAVNGDELRSTTIRATLPKAEYQNDWEYTKEWITHFEGIALDIVSGQAVTRSTGNTATQITLENFNEYQTIIDFNTTFIGAAAIGAGNPEPVVVDLLEEFPQGDLNGVGRATLLYTDYRNYVEFRTQSADTDPAVTGTNGIQEAQNVLNTANAFELNKFFIQEELVAFIKGQYPEVTFSDDKLRNDVSSLLRGITFDLRYPGNYKTLLAAGRYVGGVLGTQNTDLFRLRDTTGLRDCTTGGLVGVLQPPEVFELYQRPTGGACVALDPGWGPADERTWIKQRSPYIQGVTNTGTGCIGKKVDGSLHNGGNKSMVSNDFTQVLSDGVGVWVSDNARTELVSVFTYYCQIGYFAEDGGTIRATNGNNSYGVYGAIADGADETETPQEVTVNNRNNEAEVVSAFAGGIADEILLYEYANAGQDYTSATATVIGSGSNATTEYTEYRDNGIFEARLTKGLGDSGTEGGTGYLTRRGSAQETLGATDKIRLSANDVTQELSEIKDMRIIITDGTGVGQYGIIKSFDFVTKECDIYKESDPLVAGWDHIIPGTQYATDLDLTTRYIIEPMLTVTAPGFNTVTTANLFANRQYVDLKYANTKEVFLDVSGAAEIPFVDDNGAAITVNTIVSNVALQLSGNRETLPDTPFEIEGDTSGTKVTVEAVTANLGNTIEIDIDTNGNNFVEGESLTLILVSGTGNTFDDDPTPATFDITRVGKTYTVELNAAGAGYTVGDTISIVGGRLSGVTGTNDISIRVTEVSDDSASTILDFEFSGTSRPERFVALTNQEYAQYSDNGINWTEVELSFIGNYKKLIASDKGKFIALAENDQRFSYSLTGEEWQTGTLPTVKAWTDGIYADDQYVIIASDSDDVYTSPDGVTWTARTIDGDDGGDESSISQWSHITYGKGQFLAISANDRATATSPDGVTWTRHDEVLKDLIGDGQADWDIVGVEYGDNRYIVLDATGRNQYSFDGITWYDGETVVGTNTWTKFLYRQGIFIAIGTDTGAATSTCVTTEYGLKWESKSFTNSKFWAVGEIGIVGGDGTWVFLANGAQTDAVEHIQTGRSAKLRAEVISGSFRSIKIWDPGSGYTSVPTLTITDPNADTDIVPEIRISQGVLPQPSFINRGSGYRTSTSQINITGNGFADVIPKENILVLSGVKDLPGPGVQIRIADIYNLDTEDDEDDLKVYSGITVTNLGDDGSGNGTKKVQFTVSPRFTVEEEVIHGANVTLRERYSQCRITGHDFLDIGTGNFIKTNYPKLYSGGDYFIALPENEVYEANGGRVYYTSTDQDGNFRTGELFAVQQSTGIVTISAQFFDLDGLSELSLGGVRLGGSGTVVNEFSTDPTFSADSNSVIPTQRAIGTFLANRLSVGGENLEVNRLVAGRISVGGQGNVIDNITGEYLVIPNATIFDGTFTDENEVVRPSAIQGTIVSQMMFLKTTDDFMQ